MAAPPLSVLPIKREVFLSTVTKYLLREVRVESMFQFKKLLRNFKRKYSVWYRIVVGTERTGDASHR